MREAFPHASRSKSLYEVRKLIRELGLCYEKIDACPNYCMLYWKENKDKIICDVCHTSRYKQINNNDSEEESTTQADNYGDYKAKKVGAKVLHYFPLIPRLQRLFMSLKTAESTRWHQESRTKDGLLRHPADSPAWKTFIYQNCEFAKEPRNVRLGLASDGFNPFGNMSVSYSTWPVVVIPYNLPPLLRMKKHFLLITLLIPGPSAPCNIIDIYMQPLIDELKELWDTEVNTYDASTKSNFPMCACLIWTISDFPAYANLSGWSIKGILACPSYHKETKSVRLSNSHKESFIAHRRWLELLHAFRCLKDSFGGTEEHEGPPRCLIGEEVLAELEDGKAKDHLKSRHDLKEMGIRHEFHPEVLPNGKVYLSPTCFVMDKNEKEKFCKVLKGVKVPDGYTANISRYLATLKSYLRNGSKPEGSIAKGYLAEECVSFCSLYLASDVETIHNKTSRNHGDGGDETILPIFCMSGRPIGATNVVKLGYDTLAIAHSYVLEHLNILSQENWNKCKHYIERLHSQKFEEWLYDYDMAGDNRITSDITALANDQFVVVKKYKGYIINGF
ncbi:uncharacterized protein [Rutidosis leptorrhynchoides]|uniref:uncharacterized protein n=1 Tax=Rutidosis leptorrhynchoides TaxID=125765 RepID=UPI003A98E979